jgi:hypothetical protein
MAYLEVQVVVVAVDVLLPEILEPLLVEQAHQDKAMLVGMVM